MAELDDAIPDYGVDHRTGQADVLLQLSEVAEFFHTSDGAAYADVEVSGHRATTRCVRETLSASLRDVTRSDSVVHPTPRH